MGNKHRIILDMIVPLVVWGVIALFAISNPVPVEPEEVPADSWSYYSGHPPHVQYLVRNRDVMLVSLFLCAVIVGVILHIADDRR